MKEPMFVVRKSGGFLGSKIVDKWVNSHTGPKSVFGPIKRLYIHGKLESKLKFDVPDFISGDIQDLNVQPCGIMDSNGIMFSATIVMVTSDKGYKYAFIVEQSSDEIQRAERDLWNGEWLIDGKERY